MAKEMHVAGYSANIDDPDAFVARLRAVSEKLGSVVEVYDASIVLGAEHVISAWGRAERAHASGRAVAGSVAMEARLYISCEGQIKAALAKTDGNRTHAAELLGISRRALVYKLKRMGINPAPGAREQASPGGDAEGVS